MYVEYAVSYDLIYTAVGDVNDCPIVAAVDRSVCYGYSVVGVVGVCFYYGLNAFVLVMELVRVLLL